MSRRSRCSVPIRCGIQRGSLTGEKARTPAEFPQVPVPEELTIACHAAQPALRELVEAARGRPAFRGPGKMKGEGHIDLFVPVMREWAEHHSTGATAASSSPVAAYGTHSSGCTRCRNPTESTGSAGP